MLLCPTFAFKYFTALFTGKPFTSILTGIIGVPFLGDKLNVVQLLLVHPSVFQVVDKNVSDDFDASLIDDTNFWHMKFDFLISQNCRAY